ncbi:MAG: S8 family serine peptidase [Bdellovibrionota bacterium]
MRRIVASLALSSVWGGGSEKSLVVDKRVRHLILFIFLLSNLGFAKEYLIKWKSLNTFKNIQVGDRSIRGLDILEKLSPHSRLTKVEINDSEKQLVLSKIKMNPDVEYVVPNKKFFALGMQSSAHSPKLQQQWALQKVNAPAAWSMAGSKGSRAIVVAVLDTGIDLEHESLKANIISGFDFKDNDSDPTDVTSILNPGHGTHCSGIAAATGLVENAVSGISPELSIMPVRILGKDGSGDMDDAVQGVDYAVEHGAHIISASWSGEMFPSEAAPLVEAVQRARDAGVLFVTSSGNGDENGISYNIDYLDIYPAGIQLSNVITVAATDESDMPAIFSNVGMRKVHIAAPGVKIISTLPKSRYDVLSGTSMSAPLVAGLAAYLKSLNPKLSPEDLKAILLSTGTSLNIKTACNCRVDAWSATDVVLHKKPYLLPNAATLALGDTLHFELKNSNAVNFVSSDSSIAHVSASGVLESLASGRVKVTATDVKGNTLSSNWIRIKAPGDDEEDDDGSSSSQSSDPYACPLETPQECEDACKEHEGLPWCEISRI